MARRAFVRKITGEPFVAPAAAQTYAQGRHAAARHALPGPQEPHTYSWIESANVARQVLDYLAVTGVDNIIRPGLIEKWEASPI